jgi:NADH:ubiquinone oxidoreductase subunit 3 (subunit A)
MNPVIEIAIIIVVVALAAVFTGLRIARALRRKRPSCCSGGADMPQKGTPGKGCSCS